MVRPPGCEQDQDRGEADEQTSLGELKRPVAPLGLVDDVADSRWRDLTRDSTSAGFLTPLVDAARVPFQR
jgi:hypothetical protein